MFHVDFDEVSNFPFTTSENCARHECESAVKSKNAANTKNSEWVDHGKERMKFHHRKSWCEC